MHKPKSVFVNEMNKILWDFKILTDHLISTRRPDQVIINKKIKADYKVKIKESEKNDKYWDLAREKKKLGNMRLTVISPLGMVPQRQKIKGRIERMQTTALLRLAEKSPGELRRHAVTQTLVKDYQLTLVEKFTSRYIYIYIYIYMCVCVCF